MTIPFTIEQFFAVFVRYNQGVWPMQIVLTALALLAVGLLLRGRPNDSRAIAAVLALLWGWMAIGYHFVYFRAINPAAWPFGAVFLAGAIWFAWAGAIRARLAFHPRGGLRGWIGGLLIAFALVGYPLLGHALGHRYPATPTFGLPCPTTIFTIGLLLFAASPVPRSVFVVPVLWAGIGSVAAFRLGVTQDFALLVAGVVGLIAAIVVPSYRLGIERL